MRAGSAAVDLSSGLYADGSDAVCLNAGTSNEKTPRGIPARGSWVPDLSGGKRTNRSARPATAEESEDNHENDDDDDDEQDEFHGVEMPRASGFKRPDFPSQGTLARSGQLNDSNVSGCYRAWWNQGWVLLRYGEGVRPYRSTAEARARWPRCRPPWRTPGGRHRPSSSSLL